jgi:4-diphosphocytidyl-2-C-methyl-D-erythritol kinase
LSRFFVFYVVHAVVLSMPRAYAKINIGLFIFPRRADGFHDLLTVFHRVDISDEITFEPSDEIRVVSSSPEAPGGESNICHRAARLLQEHLHVNTGARIHLKKAIPVGAGLGGGSADAGCVLRELPRFWRKQVHPHDLKTIARSLGSDVPFFLAPGSAIGRGRGEILSYFPLKIPYTIVLCNPNIHVATKWAYQHVTPRPLAVEIDLKHIIERGGVDPSVLREHIVNDFETSVFEAFPIIGEIKHDMLKGGAVFALMSGSGSTVYGFFKRSFDAARIAERLADQGNRVFLTPPEFTPE